MPQGTRDITAIHKHDVVVLVLLVPTIHSSCINTMEVITFALHPNRKLNIIYIQNIADAPAKTSEIYLKDNRFALLNPRKLLSAEQDSPRALINEIGAAANVALLRGIRRKNNKTAAVLDTIVCIAGTSNSNVALRDYGFGINYSGHATTDGSNNCVDTASNAILLGFDSNRNEMEEVIKRLNVTEDVLSFSSVPFAHADKDKYVQDMIKSYKLTKEEVNAFGLEESVLMRIATKFVI